MSLARILSLVIYYLTLIFRNKGRLIDLLVWPVLELVTFGFLSIYLQTETIAAPRIVFTVLGGLIFWHFFSRIMNEILMQITDDAYSRNLGNIISAPITLIEWISSLIIAGIAKLSIHFFVVIPLLWLLYRLNIFSIGPILAVFIFILIFWGVILGLATSSLFFILGPRAGAFSWVISGLIQPFSLVFYPRSILPEPFKLISYLTPASYIFESLRSNFEFGYFQLANIFAALSLCIIYFFISCLIFSFSFKLAKKTGNICKL